MIHSWVQEKTFAHFEIPELTSLHRSKPRLPPRWHTGRQGKLRAIRPWRGLEIGDAIIQTVDPDSTRWWRPIRRWIQSRIAWGRDITAGALASMINLPVCVASGVLAFAPLGPDYAAMGAAAGLCGAIVAGAVSALVATSSFITTSPRVSKSLLLASLIIALSHNPAVANDEHLIVVAHCCPVKN